MKTVKLQIGILEPRRARVWVEIQEPETRAEWDAAARGSDEVLSRWCSRAWKIEHQERSGGRDAFRDALGKMKLVAVGEGSERYETPDLTDKKTAEIVKAIEQRVRSYNPTAKGTRGGGRRSAAVKMPKADSKGQIDLAEFKRLNPHLTFTE